MARMVYDIDDIITAEIELRYLDDEIEGKYGLPDDPAVHKVMQTIVSKLGTILPEAPCDPWLVWDEVMK